jgi:hypothetical protein
LSEIPLFIAKPISSLSRKYEREKLKDLSQYLKYRRERNWKRERERMEVKQKGKTCVEIRDIFLAWSAYKDCFEINIGK